MAWTYDHPRPAVATDIAIFTLRGGALRLLLIRRGGAPFQGEWALPGGFLREGETLDACARRELLEETGVDAPLLHPFANFSDPGRDPRGWVISAAHLALLPSDRLVLRADTDAADARWFALDALPTLAFDHEAIVATALADLRRRLAGFAILFALLPDAFTFGEFQAAYEAVSGTPVEKRNFRKSVIASGLVGETQQLRRGAHRPARLFIRACARSEAAE
jgi:8-oxo-dGTP diphosphatase